MTRSTTCAACVVLLCLLLGSCADLDRPKDYEGPLAFDSRKLTDAIPADYGDLVSVTTTQIYPGWVQLWFQKEDKTIVGVFVQFDTGQIKPEALLIPRS